MNKAIASVVAVGLLALFCSYVTPISAQLLLLWVVLFAILQLVMMHRQYQRDLKNNEQEASSLIQASHHRTDVKQKQLHTLASNIPSALLLLDEQGKVVLRNRHFDRFLLGQPEKQFRYHDNSLMEDVKQFVEKAYLSEVSLIENIRIQEVDYQAISVPIVEKNRFTGCLCIFQDVTIAMEKERSQRRFMADASHELKTPITSIKGMVEILTRPDFDDEETRTDFLKQIAKETQRLEHIVQDLLQLSRLSSKTIKIEKQPVDLVQLAHECADRYKYQLQEKQMKLTIESESELWFDTDPTQLTQALDNLISNALRYSDKGTIAVCLTELNDRVEISIQDEGIGIEQAELSHLFDRFYRVDSHRSRCSGGSGLGLAIVQQTMQLLQGDVRVESQVQQGSTFTLILNK